jgi:DNA-binding NarL/FixJ family response regulator
LIYRVLVVDDYEPWRRYISSTLQLTGSRFRVVSEASDGPEAVRKAATTRPDLILLDIGLPKLNGIQAARRILAHDPGSRVLFVSEHRAWAVAEVALGTGAHGYVIKSEAARELLPAMEAIVDGRRFISAGWEGRIPLKAERGQSRCHEAAFHSDDASILDDYARLAEAALRAGDAFIVITTEASRNRLQHTLRARGVDIDHAITQVRYRALDVADVFSRFLVDGWPHESRFWQAATTLVMEAARASRGKHPRVVACGECASLLWRAGKGDAAVRLEQLWDEIAGIYTLDVFCPYAGDVARAHTDIFQRICAAHTAVHSR